MKIAIKEAELGIRHGHGGPFGAVIVKNGKLIAKGHNQVLISMDSTHHGEIDVIRKAEHKLKTHDLSGCQLYTTGEPCPMCLSAALWANIDKIYYGCSLKDNEKIGFRDKEFTKMLGDHKHIPKKLLKQKDRKLCLKLFNEYTKTPNSKTY